MIDVVPGSDGSHGLLCEVPNGLINLDWHTTKYTVAGRLLSPGQSDSVRIEPLTRLSSEKPGIDHTSRERRWSEKWFLELFV